MTRTRWIPILLALAGCGAGGLNGNPPGGSDYFSEMSPTLRWSSAKTANPLKVFIGLDGASDRSATVLTALNAWSTATGDLVRFERVGTIGEADMTIQFAASVPGDDGGLGDSEVDFNIVPGNPTADGIITASNITIKNGVSTALLLPLVEHEVGHGLGLVARNAGDVGHSSYSGDLMYSTVTSSSALRARDAETLRKLYARSRSR